MTLARPSAGIRQQGFTLVELLVVFAIGALLVALVPVAFDKLKASTQYRDTVRNFLADLRLARQTASTEQQETQFAVDLKRRTYGVLGGKVRPLFPGVEVKATVAAQALTDDQVAAISFYPNGGGSGGTFEILRPSGAGTRLLVDWLTGHVTQAPVAQ